MIKNCIFKSKLQDFLERASNRLIEKAFDKIKENNWNIEERKEILEEILIKQQMKRSFSNFKQKTSALTKFKKMILIFEC